MYFGTARGLDQIDLQTKRVRHYTRAEGLASSAITVAFRDRQGALWFGTFSGLSRLEPQNDLPPAAPSILISGLRIAGVRHPLSELGQTEVSGLTLNPSQNNVQIDFFSLSLGHAPLVRYQYKLEGGAGDWSAPTEQRTVTYANLAAGSYRFLVRAIRPDSEPSVQSATISFVVLRPVWQRWWFVTLSAFLLVGFAYWLYRYRLKRLLELERVRTRIATDLHDDIGASLSRVAILSEVERRQNTAHNGESEGRLAEIANSARELVDSMSDIVWSVDPRRDDLGNVVTRVRQFGADVFEALGIEWELEVTPDLEKTKLTPEQRRDIFLVCKEALNNVARHAGCRRATLSLRVSGQQILVEIKDDGCGFAPAAVVVDNGRGGHGLANMRARAARLGGSLGIVSDPGQGTHLNLKIPLHRRT